MAWAISSCSISLFIYYLSVVLEFNFHESGTLCLLIYSPNSKQCLTHNRCSVVICSMSKYTKVLSVQSVNTEKWKQGYDKVINDGEYLAKLILTIEVLVSMLMLYGGVA